MYDIYHSGRASSRSIIRSPRWNVCLIIALALPCADLRACNLADNFGRDTNEHRLHLYVNRAVSNADVHQPREP